MIKTRNVDVLIQNQQTGEIIYKKDNFEVPENWSDQAAAIAASKYATGGEDSALDIIDRVVNWIADQGEEQGYFPLPLYSISNTENKTISKETFVQKLKNILIGQQAAPNSPTWFNVGVDENPQVAACYILPIEDTMEDILYHNVRSGRIFKFGSGVGINVSKLRAKGELLSNRGYSSGPLSFMKMWDTCAGSVRSGGRTRRSAVLVSLDVDHPDIMDFIECKKLEEDKAKALVAQGISPEEAYETVAYQNANHSVAVTDEFMEAAESGSRWITRNRGDGATHTAYASARKILKRIAKIAWETGDPGILYKDRINSDNPVPTLGKIRSTNPCGELCAVDNSACNLASINLTKYLFDKASLSEKGLFKNKAFIQDIEILISAMDMTISPAGYPTEEVREMAINTRPLGLGYTNLGALLIRMQIPYGSEEACKITSAITKTMTHTAYLQSSCLANKLGSFKHFSENRNNCARIAVSLTEDEGLLNTILENGLRNSQLTLLAPTGTISLLMDCDSTGIEPLFSLETLKTLSGGGTMTLTPACVKKTLERLKATSIEDLPDDKMEIFRTANAIPWKKHIDMVAAAQKHLNGSVSKTINMPNNASVEEIQEAYFYAERKGLKALSVYRDGSKQIQPLTAKEEEEEKEQEEEEPGWQPVRRRPSQTMQALIHRFNISGIKGFIQPGIYEDGSLGELFLRVQKQGSTFSGLMDSFAVIVSLALQYGVPLEVMADKMIQTKFDPQGFTGDEDIPMASSIMDYIFRWLVKEFGEDDDSETPSETSSYQPETIDNSIDASGAPCAVCGAITVRNGTCWVCPSCGTTTGCS